MLRQTGKIMTKSSEITYRLSITMQIPAKSKERHNHKKQWKTWPPVDEAFLPYTAIVQSSQYLFKGLDETMLIRSEKKKKKKKKKKKNMTADGRGIFGFIWL